MIFRFINDKTMCYPDAGTISMYNVQGTRFNWHPHCLSSERRDIASRCSAGQYHSRPIQNSKFNIILASHRSYTG